MPRSRSSIFAGLLCLLTAAACSDNPTAVTQPGSVRPDVVVPTETLDQSVGELLALFPKGVGNAATTRWTNVKRKYAAGLTDPSQMKVAKQMLFELSDWVSKKTPEMDTPPNNETKSAAAARAVLYMSMYVYSGPGTSPPPFAPAADAVVGIVTPGAGATIVTPTTHAGVQFEAGSVEENTVVVVTQNLTPFPANCSGPLQTKLCQYPQFYTFEQFPHKRLLKAAKFAVCHVNSGEERSPLADHDRFRLAHSKPASSADYTPGSTIRDQNGESIEILPLVSQTFSTCEETHYHSAMGPGGNRITKFLSRLAQRIQKTVTPRTAYAIDVGLGGLGFDMSPFNVVDPIGTPDRAVQSLTAAAVCEGEDCSLRPGRQVGINYTVSNIGTATGDSVPATVSLLSVAQNPEDPGVPVEVPLGSFTLPILVPGAVATASNVDFMIPATLSPGSYTIRLSVEEESVFPEGAADRANNVATISVNVAPPSGAAPGVVRVCATSLPEGPPTVPSLAQAMQLVAVGGTVRICAGTYSVFDVDLNAKPMTIEGEGQARPILDAGGHGSVFYMDSPSPVSSSVILRRLRLQNGSFAGINVLHHHAALLIDDVEFHPVHGTPPVGGGGPPELAYSGGVGVFDAVGTGVTIQNSTFIGGDIGVHASNAANVVVVNNSFTGQLNAAIHGGNGGDLLATNNTITNCGTHWCIGMFNSGVTGRFRFLNNSITIDFSRRTDAVMALHRSEYEVRGNTITGVGGTRDPSTAATWPITSAVFTNEQASTTISSNRISGAFVGIHIVSGTVATGSDNIVTGVAQGLRVFLANSVSITRSDFSDYTTAIATDAPGGIARCNWWGSAIGPQGANPGVSPVTYLPYATQPIANTANLCDTNAPAPPIVRVCATGSPGGPITIPDLRQALQAVAASGTVRICGGVYAVSDINLNQKSVTIEGEGTQFPRLDAGGQANVFSMSSPVPIDNLVILRRLRLANAQFSGIVVQNFYGTLLVDSVEFLPTHGIPPNPAEPSLAYSSGIFVGDATGNGVIVQNSTFTGGDIGVHAHNASNVVVVNSTFNAHTNAAIHGNGGGLYASANVIRNCGSRWCIGLFNSSGRGNHRIMGNVIVATATGHVQNAIQTFGADAEIAGNEIGGTGGSRSPSDRSSWPIETAIAVDGTSAIRFYSNSVSGAHTGISIYNGTSVLGNDNLVANVSIGITMFQPGNVQINRSDFTSYTSAYGGAVNTTSLRCNWWGSVEGPSGIIGVPDVERHTPWALEPIGQRPSVACPATP
jgi:hypothetical protein